MAFDFGDIASRYAQARWDQATSPFTDPEAYLNQRLSDQYGVDMNGNVKPKSTTISYNDDGTQTVTQKQEIVPPSVQAEPVVAPVSPQQFQAAPPAMPAMPQPGPGVQVASVGPTIPAMPQTAAAPAPAAAPAQQPPTIDQLAEMERQKRMAAQAQAPVEAPVAPAMPQLPQPGPGVQVAGPAQLPPVVDAKPAAPAVPAPVGQTVNAAPAPAPVPSAMQSFGQLINIQNDPTKLAAYYGNESNNPEARKLAAAMYKEHVKTEDRQAQAEQMLKTSVETGNWLPLMKEIKSKSEDGSYVKAILFARLGLTDLAKEEQQKLGAGTKYEVATGPKGEQALIQYDGNGLPLKGFNADGTSLTAKELSSFAAGAQPTKSYLLPSVHGTPVQNAQGETGLMMYDPRTRSSYIQVGNERRSTAGWTTMSQNPAAVYGAAGARQQGTQAAETGVQQRPLPPMAGQPAPAAPAGPVAPTATPTGAISPAASAARVSTAPAATSAAPAAPARLPGGGVVVTQQPGESFSAFKQRERLAQEQGQANIQLGKEVAAAEQKVPAEAKGKTQAKVIQQQAFADSAYPIVSQIGEVIKQSTGSGVGAKVDDLARMIGSSPKGAQAIAQLETLASPLVSMVPRFEGSQSDRDVIMYQKQAGDFANPKLPIAERLAALQGMIKLMKIYDKSGNNDWSALSAAQQEKTVDGKTYVYDGKGWKEKK